MSFDRSLKSFLPGLNAVSSILLLAAALARGPESLTGAQTETRTEAKYSMQAAPFAMIDPVAPVVGLCWFDPLWADQTARCQATLTICPVAAMFDGTCLASMWVKCGNIYIYQGDLIPVFTSFRAIFTGPPIGGYTHLAFISTIRRPGTIFPIQTSPSMLAYRGMNRQGVCTFTASPSPTPDPAPVPTPTGQ